MHGFPTARELAEALEEFLREEVMPSADDRLRFRALVAANVAGQIERELALGEQVEAAHRERLAEVEVEDDRELAEALRAGRLDDRMHEVLALLRATAADRLRTTNPRHLLEQDRR